MEIKPEEWTALAWKAVRASRKASLQGVELDDMFQCAMLGIIRAAKSHKGDKEGFPAYAYWFMHRQINNMIYKRTGGTQIPRTIDVLFSEMDEEVDIGLQEDCTEDEVFTKEFINTFPLSNQDKQFFNDLIEYGDRDASERYILATGNTRQRAKQKLDEIRVKAQAHYKELTC